MIDKEFKPEVKLVQIDPFKAHEFRIDTFAGRDAIVDQLKEDIDTYSHAAFYDGPRTYIGASVVGHDCERYIWFSYRWMHFDVPKPKTLRLFNRGHLEEERILAWLKGLGFNVIQIDETTGKQQRFSDCDGHFGGSSDGRFSLPVRYGITGCFGPQSDILLEIKTANESQFNKLIQGGGLIKGKPRHYAQMCLYGYKMKLKYGLYIVVNKNTDDLHIELVELNEEYAKYHIDKAANVINSQTPPRRISENASYWECKFCPMNGVCHLNEPIEKNCRSCVHAVPVADAQWHCTSFGAVIPKEFIAVGCNGWQALPR